MNRNIVLVLAALAVAAGPAVGASAAVSIRGEFVIPPEVIAPVPPPPIREEVVPAPVGPVEASVWVPGHWEWSGRSYFWVNGHYIERPEPGLIWEPGRWIDHHGHWGWAAGHWRR